LPAVALPVLLVGLRVAVTAGTVGLEAVAVLMTLDTVTIVVVTGGNRLVCSVFHNTDGL
jgi:hypothetical protein